jgi:hypothetical protein
MILKISLNPILPVAAAVVAYASGANASTYYADFTTKTCKNTPLQTWGYHFTTIAECCREELSYVAENVCVAESNGQIPTGTSKWYVNWDSQNCVQDCVDSSNPDCGGLAAGWVSLFASQGECCEDSFTVDYRGDCLVPSSSPSAAPSVSPSAAPSDVPSASPSESPSDVPSASPSDVPSASPSESPSDVPSASPSESPSGRSLN